MSGGSMRSVTMFGAVLILLGLLGFAIPVFSTSQTQDVVKLGDLKIQTTQHKWYSVPPLVSGGALAVGVVLVGAGLLRRP